MYINMIKHGPMGSHTDTEDAYILSFNNNLHLIIFRRNNDQYKQHVPETMSLEDIIANRDVCVYMDGIVIQCPKEDLINNMDIDDSDKDVVIAPAWAFMSSMHDCAQHNRNKDNILEIVMKKEHYIAS